jgi:hypothetical protein
MWCWLRTDVVSGCAVDPENEFRMTVMGVVGQILTLFPDGRGSESSS